MASVGVFLVDDVHGVLADARRVRARRSCWISGRRPFARPCFPNRRACHGHDRAAGRPLCDCAPRPAPEYCAVRCAEEINTRCTPTGAPLSRRVLAARDALQPQPVCVLFRSVLVLVPSAEQQPGSPDQRKGEGALPGHLTLIAMPAAVVAIPFCATLVSAGRDTAYHTPAQVIVGALVGSMAGLTWYEITCVASRLQFFHVLKLLYWAWFGDCRCAGSGNRRTWYGNIRTSHCLKRRCSVPWTV